MSFDIRRGETFGIVGQNGSGKSTLLKCLARILRPDSAPSRSTGRSARCWSSVPGSTGAVGPRERVPERFDPRAQLAPARRSLRRDRRVRRARALHRHAREELLVRYVCALRVLGGHQRRSRRAALLIDEVSPSATRSSSAAARRSSPSCSVTDGRSSSCRTASTSCAASVTAWPGSATAASRWWATPATSSTPISGTSTCRAFPATTGCRPDGVRARSRSSRWRWSGRTVASPT